MTIGYDKNGNIIEIYGLPSGGGGGGGDVTMAQVRAEIAKNVGKGVQLGFDGTLANNVLTFEPPTGTSAYEIKENYDYEIDLSFQATSTADMDDETAMQIVNNGTTYQFWTVKDTPATWGDLKDIYTYDTTNGYRWLFKARYHVTSSGNNVFYIFPAVDNSLTSVQLYSDGNAIYDKQGGSSLSYTQIYELISSKYNLVNVNYDNVITLYPVFWDGSAISFSNTYIYDSKCWQQRLIINSDNQVLFNEYQAITPIDYATTTTGGAVKVDGSTITINEDGTISSMSGYIPSGTVITVAPSGADFTDLQSAVDSLTDKWTTGYVTISVASGTYTPSSSISISGGGNIGGIPLLKIIGESYDDTIIDFKNVTDTNIFNISEHASVSIANIQIKNVKRGFCCTTNSDILFSGSVKVDTASDSAFFAFGGGTITFAGAMSVYVNSSLRGVNAFCGGNIASGYNTKFIFSTVTTAFLCTSGIIELGSPTYTFSSVTTTYGSTKNAISSTGGLILVNV